MRKTICLLPVLFLGFVLLSYAEGKLVAVTSEKEIEISNGDVAAARTVALAAAARDAVEKAYGSYVKVEEMPDARQVMAKASAGLQYKVLAEQQKGNRYWVKIQANVIIPEEYAKETQTEEREDLGDAMGNFAQKYPQGEINWGAGYVLAFGKGVITEPTMANAEESAARAAEVDAKAHLIEIINDIAVDDRSKIGQDKRMSFALEGFVQGAEVVARSRTGSTVNVTVQAPIRGVKGLSMTIFGYYTPAPRAQAVAPTEPEKKPEQKAEKPETTKPPKQEAKKTPPTKPETKPETKIEAETKTATKSEKTGPATPETKDLPEPASEYTGIVIDARAVAVAPALFPKISDTNKQEVYSTSEVNKDDLQKRGMASYAVVSRDVQISKLYPRAIVVQVRYMADQPEPAKNKRRQGYHPVVVKLAGADGATIKSNLIISEEDAKKLKQVDQTSNALKECRVVVVVSSEVGGLEGRLIVPDAL